MYLQYMYIYLMPVCTIALYSICIIKYMKKVCKIAILNLKCFKKAVLLNIHQGF